MFLDSGIVSNSQLTTVNSFNKWSVKCKMQKSYFIYYIVPKKIMTVNQIDLLMASGILVWARGTMSSNVASNTCRQ